MFALTIFKLKELVFFATTDLKAGREDDEDAGYLTE